MPSPDDGSGRCGNANIRALWWTFLLNTGFTVAQVAGAAAANSLAMMGDTGTMLVDSATYAINIYAEYQKAKRGPEAGAKYDVAASIFSVITLVGVTVYVMADAVGRLQEQVRPLLRARHRWPAPPASSSIRLCPGLRNTQLLCRHPLGRPDRIPRRLAGRTRRAGWRLSDLQKHQTRAYEPRVPGAGAAARDARFR